MKTTFRKFSKSGKSKFMIAGGLGKNGPYAYAGIKKGKNSLGVSNGTRGREMHIKHKSLKIKHNLDTKSLNVKLNSKRII